MTRKKRSDPPNQTSTERLPSPGEGSPPPPPPRGAVLVVHYRDGVDAARLEPEKPLTVGRMEPSDLIVADRTLSRMHARFTLQADGQRILVEDLGSTNGTFIDGAKVESPIEIGTHAALMLGTAEVRISPLGAAAHPAVEGHEAFRRRIEEKIQESQHFRRRFAIVAVSATSAEAERRPVGGWVEGLRGALRPIDRVSLYTPDTALVLLPETEEEEAMSIARTLASQAEGGGQRRAGLAVYPQAASTADKLVDLARGAAAEATLALPVKAASTEPLFESPVGDDEEPLWGAATRELRDKAVRIAPRSSPIILHGETGTGKEVLARFIHRRSRRRGKIININCGAIPAELVESTLFGHEKGSFTGATQQRQGAFEMADGGTLFLDEIGELPLAAQVALLRVLESGCITRIGSHDEKKVKVRVIAATHRDLKAMVEENRFREDLYYRLHVIPLSLPPLRERIDEIGPLVQRFLAKECQDNGLRLRGFTDEAMAQLQGHDWPGNIRELRNAVEYAAAMAQCDLIGAEDLPPAVRAAESSVTSAPNGGLKADLERLEAMRIKEALIKHHWDRAAAAAELGMTDRTLRRKMTLYGIKKPRKPRK